MSHSGLTSSSVKSTITVPSALSMALSTGAVPKSIQFTEVLAGVESNTGASSSSFLSIEYEQVALFPSASCTENWRSYVCTKPLIVSFSTSNTMF